MEKNLERHIDELITRYPKLQSIRSELCEAYEQMEDCYICGGKLLIAGNGGSAADAGHMVGELMKNFRLARPVSESFCRKLEQIDENRGAWLGEHLQMPLTAISLTAHEALSTACANDTAAEDIFAQQLLGFGRPGDVFLGISTSGNSRNILDAAVTAKAMGIKVIGLTGRDGGQLAGLSDVTVGAPETETYRVQELHLPIYHCWCMMLEERFFG